jgi:hypothetical protein
MKRKTSVDFTNHKLNIIKHDDIVIYEYKKPGTIINGLTFINAKGVMTVTGDFGNWVFCREFHPKKDDYVSRGYMDEKLQIASEQTSHKFDSETTVNLIKEFKKQFKSAYGRKMNDEEKDWVKDLIYHSDDQHEYIYYAYREKPTTIDYESVPFGKKRHIWLEIIYDAFNEICDLIEN